MRKLPQIDPLQFSREELPHLEMLRCHRLDLVEEAAQELWETWRYEMGEQACDQLDAAIDAYVDEQDEKGEQLLNQLIQDYPEWAEPIQSPGRFFIYSGKT